MEAHRSAAPYAVIPTHSTIPPITLSLVWRKPTASQAPKAVLAIHTLLMWHCLGGPQAHTLKALYTISSTHNPSYPELIFKEIHRPTASQAPKAVLAIPFSSDSLGGPRAHSITASKGCVSYTYPSQVTSSKEVHRLTHPRLRIPSPLLITPLT